MIRRLCLILVSVLFFTARTAFAGTWRQGIGQDPDAWWYDNGDGTFPTSTWRWLDGNGDGVAECYYFDENGKMLADTTTPDGYSLDQNGAWMLGFVRRKYVLNDTQSQLFQEAARGLLTLYEGRLYGPPGVWVQTRVRMGEQEQIKLLKALLVQTARDRQQGRETVLFQPLREENGLWYFDRAQTLESFIHAFGNWENCGLLDELGQERLAVSPQEGGQTPVYEITNCRWDSDRSFVYMVLDYEKRDGQDGTPLRSGTIYLTLLRDTSVDNGFTIDVISNSQMLG